MKVAKSVTLFFCLLSNYVKRETKLKAGSALSKKSFTNTCALVNLIDREIMRIMAVCFDRHFTKVIYILKRLINDVLYQAVTNALTLKF